MVDPLLFDQCFLLIKFLLPMRLPMGISLSRQQKDYLGRIRTQVLVWHSAKTSNPIDFCGGKKEGGGKGIFRAFNVFQFSSFRSESNKGLFLFPGYCFGKKFSRERENKLQ